jgi:hypothetical protein
VDDVASKKENERKLERIPMKLIHRSLVTRGLDPRVHLLRIRMDCRVKPGNDGG